MAESVFPRADEFANLAELPTVAMPLPERLLGGGRIVFGRYELLREVGRGGMGVVWAARDTRLEMIVALKFLPDAVACDPEALKDLRRETRCALELTHPHIVRAYTIEQETGLAAIVMELVEGQSLAHRKAAAASGSLTAAELSPLVAQLCDALDYAHRRAKVAHRDLKPANLLVDGRGELKISDFGIAHSLSETRTRLTGKAGVTSGTLLYMSPQQLLGHKATASDDLYALGATLYDLLTGKPPFFRGDLTTQIQQSQPEPLMRRRESLGHSGPAIPAHWEATIFACLAKDPSQRPPSAASVGEMLALRSSSSASAEPAATPGELTRAIEAPTRPAQAVVISPAVAPRASRRTGAKLWGFAGGSMIACAAALALTWQLPPWVKGWLSALPARAEAMLYPTSKASVAELHALAPPLVSAAREFVVEVDPSDVAARVWLGPAADLAVPRDGRLTVPDLPDGEHDLVVQAPGYEPFAAKASVVDGRGLMRAVLAPVHGTLIVAARPGTTVTATDVAGRSVTLGTIGETGELVSNDRLLIGHYALRFEHPDYAPLTLRSVEVAVGRPVRVAPVQAPPPAELRVFSVPTGAEVWVDGTEAGVTPATVRDLPSERPVSVEVRHPGYRAFRDEMTLRPREVRALNVGTLTAQAGELELRLPTEIDATRVSLQIDGRSMTESLRAAASGGVLRIGQLEIGARRVELSHADYQPWIGNVFVRDQDTTVVELALMPLPATLTLDVRGPSEFELRADGRLQEPRAISQPASVSTASDIVSASYVLPPSTPLVLDISAKGYRSVQHMLTLAPNRTETLAIRLERYLGPEWGQVWTIPVLGLDLLPIAPGRGQMGSASGVGNDERPVTRITITQPFWLGKTEVSQAQWQAVMGTTIRQLHARTNANWPLRGVGRDYPVFYVTWAEATEFCARLSERERAAGRLPDGYAYALPTEAQWEYACRAGSASDYPDVLEELAWFSGNSGGHAQPVGQKRANAWGLYDMHGNVWEWCADWYAPTLPGGSVTDPVGPSSGNYRVGRGGSWNASSLYCHAAVRTRRDPTDRGYDIGFRVALTAIRSPAIVAR